MLTVLILNRNTGAGSVIPASVDNLPGKIGALDFKPDNVLYGVQKSSRIRMAEPAVIELNGEEENAKYLIILNQSNGVTTTVGQTVDDLGAIVFAERNIEVPTI
jgi:hypothetical protein